LAVAPKLVKRLNKPKLEKKGKPEDMLEVIE